jgi:hypothetical protein
MPGGPYGVQDKLRMSHLGHFRRFEAVCDESGLPSTPDVLMTTQRIVGQGH